MLLSFPLKSQVAGHETFGWAALMDAQRAMGLVRHRAAEWHIDPDKVCPPGRHGEGDTVVS